MKDIPVYAKTASYAIEHDELEAYRTSYKMNMACKAAITDAVAKYYSDNVLHSADALKELTKNFSLERIAVVTAVSLRDMDWDGRISRDNKEWAKSVPFPKDIDDWNRDRSSVYAVSDVHPGLLNLFADTVRKELERTNIVPLKKTSLVEKLTHPLPQKSNKIGQLKDKEL